VLSRFYIRDGVLDDGEALVESVSLVVSYKEPDTEWDRNQPKLTVMKID